MALSAATDRTYTDFDSNVGSLPVKASSVIYKGSAVGLTSGYARALNAGDQFGGFALQAATGGSADGSVYVTVQKRGMVQLSITSLAVTDIGKPVYASDDGTFTLTQSTNSPIGRVHRWISTGLGSVNFNVDHPPRVTALTDNSGGTASTTIASIGATYTQSEVRNAIASLAAAINSLK